MNGIKIRWFQDESLFCVTGFRERRHSAVATFSITLIRCSHAACPEPVEAAVPACEEGIASGFLGIRGSSKCPKYVL